MFITPQCFKEHPERRFYGYKLSEYRDPKRGASALESALPHLQGAGVDFGELSRRIGWITWEDICDILRGSSIFCSDEFPHAELEAFFRERCLWPAAGDSASLAAADR